MQADVERFLAQLFVDSTLREKFLLNPAKVAGDFGLSPAECEAVGKIPPQDLLVASRSYERKRLGKHAPARFKWLKHWAQHFFNRE